jgi:hypothetical protein
MKYIIYGTTTSTCIHSNASKAQMTSPELNIGFKTKSIKTILNGSLMSVNIKKIYFKIKLMDYK